MHLDPPSSTLAGVDALFESGQPIAALERPRSAERFDCLIVAAPAGREPGAHRRS